MFIFLAPLLILLSCYVAVSDMTQENKNVYFIILGIIILLIILFCIVFA